MIFFSSGKLIPKVIDVVLILDDEFDMNAKVEHIWNTGGEK